MTKIKDYIRGDSQVIPIFFVQSDGVTPIDLTAGKVYFTVNSDAAPADDSGAVIAKTVTSFTCPLAVTIDGVAYTNGQNTATLGIAWISLTNADTQNITPGTYHYDSQLKDASGNFVSSKQDTFSVIADTTRSTT